MLNGKAMILLSVRPTKNDDPDKCNYSSYCIVFDSGS